MSENGSVIVTITSASSSEWADNVETRLNEEWCLSALLVVPFSFNNC